MRLSQHASAAMDIDAGDSALVASTRAALGPAQPAPSLRQSRGGLLSSCIPVAAVPRPELRERRCIRFLDPKARVAPGISHCPRWALPIMFRVHQVSPGPAAPLQRCGAACGRTTQRRPRGWAGR